MGTYSSAHEKIGETVLMHTFYWLRTDVKFLLEDKNVFKS